MGWTTKSGFLQSLDKENFLSYYEYKEKSLTNKLNDILLFYQTTIKKPMGTFSYTFLFGKVFHLLPSELDYKEFWAMKTLIMYKKEAQIG